MFFITNVLFHGLENRARFVPFADCRFIEAKIWSNSRDWVMCRNWERSRTTRKFEWNLVRFASGGFIVELRRKVNVTCYQYGVIVLVTVIIVSICI